MESIPFWCDINSNGNITIKSRSQWPLSCEIVGSKPAWGMDVCLLWVLYVVRCTHVTACWKRIKNDGPYRNTYLVRYARYCCIKVGELFSSNSTGNIPFEAQCLSFIPHAFTFKHFVIFHTPNLWVAYRCSLSFYIKIYFQFECMSTSVFSMFPS